MKKEFFSKVFCVIVFCMGVCVSCENSSSITRGELSIEEKRESVDNSFQVLNYQLDCYNKSFQEYRLTNASGTRGFWTWLKRIGKADALGAIGGGVLGAGGAAIHGSNWKDIGKVSLFGVLFVGICASVTEMIDSLAPDDNGYSMVMNTSPVVFSDINVSLSDSIGYFHNLIIQEIYLEDKNIFSKSFSTIQQMILKHMSRHGFTPVPDVIKVLPSKLNLVKQCLDKTDKETVQFLTVKYPQYKNEIAVLGNYLQNLSELQSKPEVIAYTSGFSNVVTNSQIPTSSVSFVQSSVSVAANSAILWSKGN